MSAVNFHYIKVDNEKIKYKSPGFTNTKMIGLYAMISSYLSNPKFEVCNGGLKTALMKHCTNQKLSFGKIWSMLMNEGYLKRCRIPFYKNKFRDYYELLPLPDHDIPAVRNLSSGQGKQYLQTKTTFLIPKHNYTGISYEMLMDPNLSLMSKGLFCIIQRLLLIAANKPDLVITKELLASNISEGSTAFNNAWKQLKSCGYLELTRIYDSDLKKFRYLYKLNTSPYCIKEKSRINSSKPSVSEKKIYKKYPSVLQPFAEPEAEIKQAPEILVGEEQHYYTESERALYNEGTSFETWLPPVYTVNDIGKLRQEIKYQIQYEWLTESQKHLKALTDTVVDILVETALINDTGQTSLHKTGSDTQLQKLRFHNLDCDAVDFALTSFEQIIAKKPIRAKKKYLSSLLFNAEKEMQLDLISSI